MSKSIIQVIGEHLYIRPQIISDPSYRISIPIKNIHTLGIHRLKNKTFQIMVYTCDGVDISVGQYVDPDDALEIITRIIVEGGWCS